MGGRGRQAALVAMTCYFSKAIHIDSSHTMIVLPPNGPDTSLDRRTTEDEKKCSGDYELNQDKEVKYDTVFIHITISKRQAHPKRRPKYD